MEALTGKLATALRRCSPHKLRVYPGGDADPRDVAVPNVRNRWSRVMETLSAIPWRKVELLDKAGDLLGVVEGDDIAPATVEVPGAGADPREERLLRLMLHAQEVALKYRDAETQALLRNTAEVTRVLTDSVKQLASIHREQLSAAVDAAHAQAEAANAANGSELQQLLEAAPQLLQMLPHLSKMLGGGKP